MAVDTRNDDIVAKYFDVVQEKIKKLIAEDKEIKPSQVEEFNDQLFNQDEEIQNQIRYFIDKATMNNLDLDRVAKVIYDKFKVQTKNNYFDTKDSQPVPNPMLGERKHIKTFEQFNESYSPVSPEERQMNDFLDNMNKGEKLSDKESSKLNSLLRLSNELFSEFDGVKLNTRDLEKIYNILLENTDYIADEIGFDGLIKLLKMLESDHKELETDPDINWIWSNLISQINEINNT